uniref:Uncharacterized protein n=1 Tax=Anopheles christyi TaxID=43041 RepID=A0A182K7Q5_9DIPT
MADDGIMNTPLDRWTVRLNLAHPSVPGPNRKAINRPRIDGTTINVERTAKRDSVQKRPSHDRQTLEIDNNSKERSIMLTMVARYRDVISLPLVVLLVSAAFLQVYGRAVPHHRRRGERVGRLENATLTNATLSTMALVGGGELSLEGCKIDHFGPALFELLQRTDCLTLRGGYIPTVTFHSHTLDTLVIDATGLRTFDVAASPAALPYEKLRVLHITRTELDWLSSRFSLFVGLKRLDLSQNQLTHVDLDVLGAMQRLRDLDLSVNRIVRLDASPELQLPGLRNLWVSYNRLRSFGPFPGAFPALDTVRLIGNRWHCGWVDRARADIIRHGITAFGADYDCPGERQGGLCCFNDVPSVEQTTEWTMDVFWSTSKEEPAMIGGDLTLRETNRSTVPIEVRYGDVEIFL